MEHNGGTINAARADCLFHMMVHAIGTIALSTKEVRDALVAAYFEHVHPFHPVISMPEFMASYRSQDNPPPLLLFQAVLMAGAHATGAATSSVLAECRGCA